MIEHKLIHIILILNILINTFTALSGPGLAEQFPMTCNYGVPDVKPMVQGALLEGDISCIDHFCWIHSCLNQGWLLYQQRAERFSKKNRMRWWSWCLFILNIICDRKIMLYSNLNQWLTRWGFFLHSSGWIYSVYSLA